MPFRRLPGSFRRALALLPGLLAACASDATGPGKAPVPGTLVLEAAGLPEGIAGEFAVTGPLPANSFTRAGAPPATWSDVPPGRYQVTIRSRRSAVGTFEGLTATPEVVVTSKAVTRVEATYRPMPSVFSVVPAGLPAGAAASFSVIAPDGTARDFTEAATVANTRASSPPLQPERWRLAARPVVVAGTRFTPSRSSVDTTVLFGDTARLSLPYSVSTGSIAVAVGGLPSAGPGNVRIQIGDSVVRTLTGTTTVAGLEPGRYRVVSAPVVSGGITFRPQPDTLALDVGASLVAVPAPITYVAQVGRLALTVGGLPAAAPAGVRLRGAGIDRLLAATSLLDSLPEGDYTLSAAPVLLAGDRFEAAPASRSVRITALATTTTDVRYALATGTLRLAIVGLPDSLRADVLVTGPGGYSRVYTAGDSTNGLEPGRYVITPRKVRTANAAFGVPGGPITTDLVAGPTPAAVTVRYESLPTVVHVQVTGLPAGTNAALQLTAPDTTVTLLTGTRLISPAAPGRWRLTASPIITPTARYQPTPSSRDTTVAPGDTLPLPVRYTITTGSLAVTVSGLPAATSGAVTVTGPNAFTRTLTADALLAALTPGSYTITSANVVSGGVTYAASPASQTVNVVASSVATTATVAYGSATSINYRIAGVYLTQAIQRFDGTVSLVANRPALLRVFVTASGANTARPDVRVRLYDGPTLLQTTVIPAQESAVRTATAEGTLGSTWNLTVPAVNVRAALRVLVDLDPAQAVPDTDRSDNVWPVGGTPRAISVTTVPPFNVRLVPVVVGANMGNVTTTNREQYLGLTRQMLPLQSVVWDVRAPFTSSATLLQPNDDNDGWSTVLSEMNALRTTDGAPAGMHYYGAVKVTYSSGIAGIGYQPGRAAVGWDYASSAGEIAVHEWGHNFGRRHTPCGVSGDPNYPYSGGRIGWYGWNSTDNSIIPPSTADVMSYCDPQWVSDYTWNGVLNYRGSAALVAGLTSANATPREGLLVWGRIRDGRIDIEPAFRVRATPSPASRGATHEVAVLDASGAVLQRLPIDAPIVDHVTGREERHFAAVLPWTPTLEAALATIRVSDLRVPTRSAIRRAPTTTAEARVRLDPVATISRAGTRTSVRWTNTDFGMAMVRDAVTGELMGFVRRSGAAVETGGRPVEVVFSDGVRSVVRR